MVMYSCQFCGHLINYCRFPCLYCGDYPQTLTEKVGAHVLSNKYMNFDELMHVYRQRMAGKSFDIIFSDWEEVVAQAMKRFGRDDDFLAIDHNIPSFSKAMVNRRLDTFNINCKECGVLITFGNQKSCNSCHTPLELYKQQRAIIGINNFTKFLGFYYTVLDDEEVTALLVPQLVKVLNDLIENDNFSLETKSEIGKLLYSVRSVKTEFFKAEMLRGVSKGVSFRPGTSKKRMADSVELLASLFDIDKYVLN